jgi:hypothetical protein
MNNQERSSDITARLESIDALPSEPVPAGWSRRNWVQREAVAFGALDSLFAAPPVETAGD